MPGRLEGWKQWARSLEVETYALALAYRDPRVPWYAKAFAACVVAYAFSPIDLIPDPIPVLGYLDDLVLVPLGIVVARRMIPHDVLRECRERAADQIRESRPVSWIAAMVVVAIWLVAAAALVLVALRIAKR